MADEPGGKVRRSSVTRCAIYTRKSSEDGLEQAFNSLDAQREACEAYIKSQRHEGWTTLATMYDDGGISGGTMERRTETVSVDHSSVSQPRNPRTLRAKFQPCL